LQLVNDNIARKFNISQNNKIVIKSSKHYKINYEVLDQRFLIHFTKLISASKRTIQNFYNYKKGYIKLLKTVIRIFSSNQSHLQNYASNTYARKFLATDNQNYKRPYFFLFPKIIAEFAKTNISETNVNSFKKNTFSRNLQNSLLKFLNFLLFEFKYDILGLKLIVSGKWKKTNSGRKQKLYLKFGQVQNSNITNKTLYHDVNQQTKYGVVSIKIWVLHKTNV
jgi:hypothetical protein